MEASKTWALAALALLAAGCVSPSQNPTNDPTFTPSGTPAATCVPVAPKTSTLTGFHQDSVSSNPGAFGDSGQMAGVSGTAEYAWQDYSGSAMIGWSGQSATGSLKLTLLNACGQSVFTQTFDAGSQGGGNQNSKPGKAGAWLVRLDYTAYTGQMGLGITG